MNGADIVYIDKMRISLLEFIVQVGEFSNSYDRKPAASSQFAAEQATFPSPESLETTLSMAIPLIESGSQHVTAFVKTVTEPMEPIACWTCVRSMLESCALAAWLLDPTIDAMQRVGRTFAPRYEGLEQQQKFGNASNQSASELQSGEDHINKVEQDAINLGFQPVLDRNGNRNGIGLRMPNATNVIAVMLDEEICMIPGKSPTPSDWSFIGPPILVMIEQRS